MTVPLRGGGIKAVPLMKKDFFEGHGSNCHWKKNFSLQPPLVWTFNADKQEWCPVFKVILYICGSLMYFGGLAYKKHIFRSIVQKGVQNSFHVNETKKLIEENIFLFSFFANSFQNLLLQKCNEIYSQISQKKKVNRLLAQNILLKIVLVTYVVLFYQSGLSKYVCIWYITMDRILNAIKRFLRHFSNWNTSYKFNANIDYLDPYWSFDKKKVCWPNWITKLQVFLENWIYNGFLVHKKMLNDL